MRTSLDTRIKFSDTDSNTEVKFGNMIDNMQDCMNLQSETAGVGVDYQLKTKRAWILSSWQLEFCGELKYGEKVEASTWPYMFKGACGKRNAIITRADGDKEPLVLANSIWALFDVERGVLCRFTDEDIKSCECEPPLAMDYKKGKIARQDFEYTRYPEFIVRKYQLDFNHHMNNSWYVKLAEEFLDSHRGIQSMRVEYKKQAVLGDVMIPYVGQDETGRIVVELRTDTQELFAVVEFCRHTGDNK